MLPCGVFCVKSSTGDVSDIGDNLTLEVRAGGDYKGVHAPNMVRM